MKKISILFFFVVLFSCKEKQPKKAVITCEVPQQFQMYKTSEMATLMRQMVEDHTQLKDKIQKGEAIGKFNDNYLKLHTATLTDSTDRDASFTAFSKTFIKVQKEIFEVPASKRKKLYNTAVNLCIACHQEHCTGPIPKIKKLLIP